jgi:hypothetical protein
MLRIVAPAYPFSANCRRAAPRIASRVELVPGRRPVRGLFVVDRRVGVTRRGSQFYSTL